MCGIVVVIDTLEEETLTKEGYLYRQMFEELFPHPSAAAGVPAEKSIACSSPTALRWDKAWEEKADPSVRSTPTRRPIEAD